MINKHIDNGKPFDWGKTSEDYAKFRDIYPPEFYDRIKSLGLCERGAEVLDIATGTGVLPRALYHTGARFTGTDISAEQIAQARLLAEKDGMSISFLQSGAEERSFPDDSFDCATACQCHWYFDHERLSEVMYGQLRAGGLLAFLQMNWLPFEDRIAAESERIILKYNPAWTGCNFVRGPIEVPPVYFDKFELVCSEQFDLAVPFTRESWHGRIRACRGVGASLEGERLREFEREHTEMLRACPEEFTILHNAAAAVLKSKKEN